MKEHLKRISVSPWLGEATQPSWLLDIYRAVLFVPYGRERQGRPQ